MGDGTRPGELSFDAVLAFWLDEVGPGGWYKSDAALDDKIRTRFSTLVERAESLTPWLSRPRSALALMIVTDQFPRNLWRGEARAFALDPLALRLAKTALNLGHDLRTEEPARQFFYLPLMHSERLADQERGVRLFLLRAPKTGHKNLPHAIKHRDVIRKFGRFPSRNAALGRPDTEAERAYRARRGYMSGHAPSG